MKEKLVGLLVALALASCSLPGSAASVQEKALASTVSLSTVVQGTQIPFCAGAVLSKHEILTAVHCMVDQEALPLLVDGVETKWERVRQDQHDHLVIRVEVDLGKKPVKMARKALQAGDKVMIFGHPHGVPTLLYREGYYAGHTRMQNTEVDFYGIQAWRGDSGGPVFNDKGEVVATVSIVYGDGAFHLMGTFPYAWDEKSTE